MGNKLIRGKNDFESWCKMNNQDVLLEEWDYKNNIVSPADVAYGSSKKVWWIGHECGHSYEASLNRRTSDGTGCPYCCKSHAKLLEGFNDLQTTNPEVLDIWDYEKNDVLPSGVMKGQHKKVWWKCKQNHSWKASIYHVTGGRGCPICRRERKTSFPEQAIFFYIKKVFEDAVSMDREVLDGKELDIYIPSLKCGIEFDGSAWHVDVEKDIEKDNLCVKKGIRLIRIRDIECPELPHNNSVFIIPHKSYSDKTLYHCLRGVEGILNISIDADLDRDRIDIYNLFLECRKERSFAENYPELCKYWDCEKNGGLSPYNFSSMSDKKAWWKCEKGHSWLARIHSVATGHGCPVCNSNRLCKGFNDFKTIYPELAKSWNLEKNSKRPEEISAKANHMIFWNCEKGHIFKSRMKTMVLNQGKNICPVCAFEKGDYKSNSYRKRSNLTLEKSHPQVLDEWDYEKNIMAPTSVTAGSDRKVWWKCRKGHSYEATVANHVVLGKGCPVCANKLIIPGENDLFTIRPDIRQYWDFERNEKDGIDPHNISYSSGKKAWWLCSKGHSRMATICSYKPNSCPICSKCGKRKVRNLDTGETFENLSLAAKSCGLKVGDTISLCCAGKQKTAGGYHWKYVDD